MYDFNIDIEKTESLSRDILSLESMCAMLADTLQFGGIDKVTLDLITITNLH